ncbi:ketopantoate reductase family protein [Paenibacillus harenae]|uniref:ketopantoate reductase family protein n=1 Tax=Paenibacillus harenae TaxID=306543 RepID=UPI0004020D27|nr:2-dehydropantoate 2-reductase [Paenibacillus harenae]
MIFDVIGGGSLGLLFGGRLAQAGADVTVWTRSREQAAELKAQGIRLQALDGGERVVPVKGNWVEHAAARRHPEERGTNAAVRFILLTVKQTDLNDRLLDQIKALAGKGAESAKGVVCLQNGIGHLERIQVCLDAIPVIAAVTTEGARRLDARTVEHTGTGQLWLGHWGGQDGNGSKPEELNESLQKMLIPTLQSAGFTSFLSNDMEDRIYNKLLINAVINPLTALFDVTNGELPAHPARRTLMKALYEETANVLRQSGIAADEDGWKLILDVCGKTSGNVSSMLGDVRAGRKTEIDAINGGIIAMARSLALQVPLNQAVTAFIHALHKSPNTKGVNDLGDHLGKH